MQPDYGLWSDTSTDYRPHRMTMNVHVLVGGLHCDSSSFTCTAATADLFAHRRMDG